MAPPERFHDRFLFRRGQQVSWYRGGGRRQVMVVSQQRYTRRDLLGPLYEYLIHRPGSAACFWASEADLEEVTDAPA